MTFLKAVKQYSKVRRKIWPEYDYIQLNSDDTYSYWDNNAFKWEPIDLLLDDILATDWIGG